MEDEKTVARDLLPGRLAGRVVQLRLDPEITAEQIHGAIDAILRLGGCLGCGQTGFDVHLLGGDPEVVAQLSAISGIQSAYVSARG